MGQPPNREVQTVAEIHARLRRDIINGRYPAGAPLSQFRLAAELGVSRTPLREAFRLLEREGLIHAEHNKRVRVTPFSIEDLEQIYAMRIVLESFAARVSVPLLTERDLAELRRLLDTIVDAATAEDYTRWHDPHHEFHKLVISGAGPRLIAQTRELADHAERYRYASTTRAPFAWQDSIVEHTDILAAVESRDAAGTAERIARHYARVSLNAVAATAPEFDPAQIREALRSVLQYAPQAPPR